MLVCLNMDIKCLMNVFWVLINIYSSCLSLWDTIAIWIGRTWLVCLICGQHICTIIKVTRLNERLRERRKERCLHHKHFFHEWSLQVWKGVITPYEKKRIKNTQSELSVRRKELFPPTSKNIKEGSVWETERKKKTLFGCFSVWAYVFLKDRMLSLTSGSFFVFCSIAGV